MLGMKRGLLIAVVAGLVGWAPNAWACLVKGEVLCTGTDIAVSGVGVNLSLNNAYFASGTTDSTGKFEVNVWGGVWDVNLSLPGDGTVSAGSVACVTSGSTIILEPFEVNVPGCAPPTTADCSPGYYKNHPEAWCDQCGYDATQCAAMVQALSTRGSSGIREAAKAEIDACFGTAEASPCADDD